MFELLKTNKLYIQSIHSFTTIKTQAVEITNRIQYNIPL